MDIYCHPEEGIRHGIIISTVLNSLMMLSGLSSKVLIEFCMLEYTIYYKQEEIEGFAKLNYYFKLLSVSSS
jgi:hypothetical protein